MRSTIRLRPKIPKSLRYSCEIISFLTKLTLSLIILSTKFSSICVHNNDNRVSEFSYDNNNS
jgi:hypothetical protein